MLTGDQADFSDPSTDDHPGIVIVTDPTRSGDGVRRGVRRIERRYPDLTGGIVYLSDWI